VTGLPRQTSSFICQTIAAAEAEGLDPAAIERRVWERHGVTCAMLALDSSGMTRVSRHRGIVHFLTRYMRMRDLAGAILERHACLAWRCFADNLFAEFKDPDTALRVAREIHVALRASGLMVIEDEPYRVCIGIGYARVLNDGPFGVMGDEMNVVAKLAEDIADAGDTMITESAFAALTSRPASVEQHQQIISHVPVTYYRVAD
jgi:class 3 adenylate cyclase